MIPTPADLSYFLEVANTLNLSRAAETLGISQPSLTLAMQRLEKSVGTPILIRHKRGVALTKAGKQFLAHTRHLLEQWHQMQAETLASVEEVQGSYTLGCHASLGVYAVPRFLADLLINHPKLEIQLKHAISRKITEQVINLEIDIGIAVNPIKHPELIIRKLEDDKFTFWHGAHARAKAEFNAGRGILLGDPELSQTQTLLKRLKKLNIPFARLLPSDNLEVIGELTKSGCGIGILPGSVALRRNLLPMPKLPSYNDEICVVYRGEYRHVKAVQLIASAIKKAF